MGLIYMVIPIALAVAAFFVLAFLWSVRNGQLDDLETPAVRMLHDDEATPRSARPGTGPAGNSGESWEAPPDGG